MPAPTPPLIVIGFGSGAGGAYITNPIPVPSQIPTAPGNASWTDGYPPQTMTNKGAGGTPPRGQDENGVLLAATANIAAFTGGQYWPFNATWAGANGGYALGAVIAMANGAGFWINFTPNNSINPDTAPAATSGWAPLKAYGSYAANPTGGVITLTAAQAAYDFIFIGGTLTSNLQIVLPPWLKSWIVFNLTSGAYSVTCKTASGTGAVIPQAGYSSPCLICGDSTNIQLLASPSNNVLLNPPGGLSGTQTVEGAIVSNYLGVAGDLPLISLWDTFAAANNGWWYLQPTNGQFSIVTSDDTGHSVSAGISITRSGTSVTGVQLGGTSQTGTTQATNDNSTKLATTAMVQAAIAALITGTVGANGSITLPVSGATHPLVIKWGFHTPGTSAGAGLETIPFPAAFPNNCFFAAAFSNRSTVGTVGTGATLQSSLSTTQFQATVDQDGSGNRSALWIAVGN